MSVEIAKKVEAHFANYSLQPYPKGQILIHAGDKPDYIYYLVSGNIRQYDISYRGDEIVVNVYKPGAFFPMLWAITQSPNKYFFDATTDVEVRVAPYDETINFLKSNTDVLFDLLTRVYIGLDGVLGRMVHLMSGSARSRLIYELIIECKRFGSQSANGRWVIQIKETELAARAGLTRETISREIQKLIKDDLVRATTKGIEIVDLKELEKI